MTRKRLKPAHRRQLILSEALHLACVRGYQRITRDEVAIRAGASGALVNFYFPRIEDLRSEVLTEAIRLAVVPVVAQALAAQDATALAAPQELKDLVASWISGGAA